MSVLRPFRLRRRIGPHPSWGRCGGGGGRGSPFCRARAKVANRPGNPCVAASAVEHFWQSVWMRDMDGLSLDALVKWADGKPLGVSLSAIFGFAATGEVREFLEVRRTRSGRFAVNPTGDDAEWFSFYRSQKRIERRVATAMLGESADLLSALMNALRSPKAGDAETKVLISSVILAFFMKPSGPKLARILELAFREEGRGASGRKTARGHSAALLLLDLRALLARLRCDPSSANATSEQAR